VVEEFGETEWCKLEDEFLKRTTVTRCAAGHITVQMFNVQAVFKQVVMPAP
jgi:hypothetical protein